MSLTNELLLKRVKELEEQNADMIAAIKSIVDMWDDIYPYVESGKYPQERLEHAEFTEILRARSLMEKAEQS